MNLSKELSIGQITYLNALRGIAAMFVLLGHASHLFLKGSLLSKSGIEKLGVIIFFLISGFLISYSVFKKYHDSSYTFRIFFIDRFCRIFCPFIPALFFVFIVDSYIFKLPSYSNLHIYEFDWIPTIKDNSSFVFFIGNLLMLQDFPLFQIFRLLGSHDFFFFIRPFGSGRPFWTISIEWWIYMFFGLISLSVFRDKKALSIGFLSLIIFVSIEPLYYLIGGRDNCLSFLWIFGMSFAFILTRKSFLVRRQIILSRNLGIFLILTFPLSFLFMIGRLVNNYIDTHKLVFSELQFCVFLSITFFSSFLLLEKIERVPFFLKIIFGFLADFSYSLYLIHFSLLAYIYLRFPGHQTSVSFFMLSTLICIITSIIFYFLFEKHHRKIAFILKDLINTIY